MTGDVDTIHYLLMKERVDVKFKDKYGKTALLHAVNLVNKIGNCWK